MSTESHSPSSFMEHDGLLTRNLNVARTQTAALYELTDLTGHSMRAAHNCLKDTLFSAVCGRSLSFQLTNGATRQVSADQHTILISLEGRSA